MHVRFSQLDAIALMALACYALAAWSDVFGLLANVAGALLCFVLVGLVWALALLPQRASVMSRLVAILACSLSAGVVGGLILNAFPAGLTRFSWLTYALIVTAVGCGVARVRGVDAVLHRRRGWVSSPTWSGSLKAVGAFVILAVAIVISLNSTNANEKEFTELWMVPDNPRNSPVRAVHATLGVKNHESSTQNYTVVMHTGRKIVTNRVTLAPQEEWVQPVIIEGVQASASLYRGDTAGDPYRTVWIGHK